MLVKHLNKGDPSLYHDYPLGRLMAEEAHYRQIEECPRVYLSPSHNLKLSPGES